MLSGKVLKKYRLSSYAVSKISTNRRKLSQVKMEKISMVSYQKEDSNQFYTKKVFHFYHQNEVFAALLGQTDLKKDKQKSLYSQTGSQRLFKQLVPNAPFLYLLKTSENCKVF